MVWCIIHRISGWLEKPKKATSAFLQMGGLLGTKGSSEVMDSRQDMGHSSPNRRRAELEVKGPGGKPEVAHTKSNFVMAPNALPPLPLPAKISSATEESQLTEEAQRAKRPDRTFKLIAAERRGGREKEQGQLDLLQRVDITDQRQEDDRGVVGENGKGGGKEGRRKKFAGLDSPYLMGYRRRMHQSLNLGMEGEPGVDERAVLPPQGPLDISQSGVYEDQRGGDGGDNVGEKSDHRNKARGSDSSYLTAYRRRILERDSGVDERSGSPVSERGSLVQSDRHGDQREVDDGGNVGETPAAMG
jgi:hypothetical protein